ncbi:MAG: DMT family transporter [Holophaga sp.]|jgi:drug/metabolite transporter (DMT)-like permease
MGNQRDLSLDPVSVPRNGARNVPLGIFIIASALCFGTMPIFGRIAQGAGVPIPTLLVLRFAIGAACLWTILACRGEACPTGKWFLLLVAIGSLGLAGQAFCYFNALNLASVGLVTLLFYLYPAMVAVLARVVLRHPLTGLQITAVVLALAGSALTIGKAGDGKPLGIALAVASAVIYSAWILAGSRLPASVPPIAATAVITTSAAVVYACLAALKGFQLPRSLAGWTGVLGLALINSVLALLFFFEGLKRVGPVRASVYSTIEPVFALVLAAALLGEPITMLRVAGGALILGAVVILAREEVHSAASTEP